MPGDRPDAKAPVWIGGECAEEVACEREHVEFVLLRRVASVARPTRVRAGLRTSSGPSQTARWFPVGDSASDAREDVGRG